MKNKPWPLFFILVLYVQSCVAPQGFYGPEEMPLRGEGAYIRVENTQRKFIRGELIASNEYGIYVLPLKKPRSENQQDTGLRYLPWSDVRAFALHYAQGKNRNWTIPFFSLVSLSHGWWAIITLPMNFFITSFVAQAARNEYSLRSKDLSADSLWKYARYPQGIPQGIILEEIKASSE